MISLLGYFYIIDTMQVFEMELSQNLGHKKFVSSLSLAVLWNNVQFIVLCCNIQ